MTNGTLRSLWSFFWLINREQAIVCNTWTDITICFLMSVHSKLCCFVKQLLGPSEPLLWINSHKLAFKDKGTDWIIFWNGLGSCVSTSICLYVSDWILHLNFSLAMTNSRIRELLMPYSCGCVYQLSIKLYFPEHWMWVQDSSSGCSCLKECPNMACYGPYTKG